MKFLFNKKVSKQKNAIFNLKIIISNFLVCSTLAIGIACLFFGIRDTYKLNIVTKGYLTTDGYLKDYSIYNADTDETTYNLIYIYEVDGKEYTIITDYGVGAEFIPEINSQREIKYNANNPAEAILSGTNRNNFLIYFGAFFTLLGSLFVLCVLYFKGVFDKVKINIVGTYMGIIYIVVGIGFILFQNGTTSSLLDTVKSLGIFILIPIFFIISGIYLTIKSLFFRNNKKKKCN